MKKPPLHLMLLPFLLLIQSCNETKIERTYTEIEAFKGIKLNSRVESLSFHKEIKIDPKDDYVNIPSLLQHQYKYDTLFEKYPVNLFGTGIYLNRVWLINATVFVPYEGDDNDAFKKIFIKKYGEPDSVNATDWYYQWNKKGHTIKLFPLDKFLNLIDRSVGISHNVTEWSINYISEDLFKIRKSEIDSLKRVNEKKKQLEES